MEAEESSVSLRECIAQEVEVSFDLTDRLQRLELPPDGIGLEELPSTLRAETLRESDWLDGDHTATRTPGLSDLDEMDLPRASFDITLSATRVYDRVKRRDVDAMSSVLTNRSHAWSLLSGLSLSRLSIIAVINLPLHDSELRSFWKLAAPDKDDNISYPPNSIGAIDPKPDGAPFVIQVKTMTSMCISIKVSASTTCLQLKEKITEKEGVPTDWQYLVCDATKRWIPEAALLGKHGLIEGSKIHLLPPIWGFRYTDR